VRRHATFQENPVERLGNLGIWTPPHALSRIIT
jgi:hypothetical protein